MNTSTNRTTDSRRDRMFALRMQLHLAKRDRDEARDQGAETARHEARIREIRDAYHAETWRGAP